ncbi:hypothetical protein [Malikia spinosa]|uniref:hypothetical protein n=1 Tax=Malikia spinosa TaxID=86180 RepID=UPI00136E9F5D|nr:hypothetical protein [Malikia spinosa]
MTLTTRSFSDYYVHANYWYVTANDKDKAINVARLLFAAFEQVDIEVESIE